MDSRYLRRDFSQLTTSPSSNLKRVGSGSGRTSQLHKARGITEVSNRNTISKDSTQSNELCKLKLRNRDTISKDLTQSDGPFKCDIRNRGATSKDKTGSGKAHVTALSPGGFLNIARMGAIPLSVCLDLYAVHELSHAQQQEIFQRQRQLQQKFNLSSSSALRSAIRQHKLRHQQQQREAMFAEQFRKLPKDMQLSPAQLHQLRQLRKRNAAAESNPEAVDDPQAIRATAALLVASQRQQQQ
ncbi:hypothetical protein V8C40DRAFT_87235 [Trichoderma camerunense]